VVRHEIDQPLHRRVAAEEPVRIRLLERPQAHVWRSPVVRARCALDCVRARRQSRGVRRRGVTGGRLRRHRDAAHDVGVQGLGRRRGVHAQLVCQLPAAVLVDPQRCRRVARRGLELHQVPPGILAERCPSQRLGQHRSGRRPALLAPPCAAQQQQRLDVVDRDRVPQLLHPWRVQTGEDRSRQHRPGAPCQLVGRGMATVGQGARRVGDFVVGDLQVHRQIHQVHAVVPGPAGDDLVLHADLGQQGTKSAHETAHGGAPPLGPTRRPQLGRELLR
jgi:hypothetical protein